MPYVLVLGWSRGRTTDLSGLTAAKKRSYPISSYYKCLSKCAGRAQGPTVAYDVGCKGGSGSLEHTLPVKREFNNACGYVSSDLSRHRSVLLCFSGGRNRNGVKSDVRPGHHAPRKG